MTTPNNEDPAAQIRHHHEELKRELAEIDQRFPCEHENGGVVHLDEGYRWRCEDCGYTREIERYRPIPATGIERTPEDKALFKSNMRAIQLHSAAEALAEALRSSLSWLTSYPGNGAESAYNTARAALAQWEEAKK